MKGSLWLWWVTALAVFGVVMIVGVARNAPDTPRAAPAGPSAYKAAVRADMCREAKEAAHYIASLSRSPSEVVRNTDRVIAERKYPTMGDKMTAMVGAMVAQYPSYMTPDDIVMEIERSRVCTG